jgi:hypothetical protein
MEHMKVLRSLSRFAVSVALVTCLCGLASAAETQPKLSNKELKTLLATAKTPADHQKLAAYYRDRAQRLNAKAQELSAQAALYANQPVTVESKQGTSCLCPKHFEHFAKLYAQQAQESEMLAAKHEKIGQDYLANNSEKQK